MRDYITTVFNLIVGLINQNKLVLLAVIGLALIIVWQLLSLMVSFNSRLAKKCRRISKFLSTKGLSADNYNKFISLIAKMPQEFIRGYKTFEHASFGLPSDYIKRFDSIDVEVNGGMFNHGKSILKSFIYGFGAVLFVLSLALMGEETALTGYGLADALLLPLLFVIIGKVIYFIFVAIKQQQYKIAVDEFNEMLDIMNDKIENNDSLPGPDILADIVPEAKGTVTTSKVLTNNQLTDASQEITTQDNADLAKQPEDNWEDEITDNDQPAPQSAAKVEPVSLKDLQELQEQSNTANQPSETVTEEVVETPNTTSNNAVIDWSLADEDEQADDTQEQTEPDEFTETDLTSLAQEQSVAGLDNMADKDVTEDNSQEIGEQTNTLPKVYKPETEETSTENVITKNIYNKEEVVEEQKRGRGRPKKVAEGELVITNDKQFEEVLERAEKLMRKSEEALSASQAKRVEKALKELVDAMTKYKEEK